MTTRQGNNRVGAYKAKTHLSELLEKVEAGEEITITKHGGARRCYPANSDAQSWLIPRRTEDQGPCQRGPPMNPAFVVDCSMAMAWLLHNEPTPKTADLLNRLATETALVPAWWFIEITNVLAMAERKGRITPGQS